MYDACFAVTSFDRQPQSTQVKITTQLLYITLAYFNNPHLSSFGLPVLWTSYQKFGIYSNNFQNGYSIHLPGV